MDTSLQRCAVSRAQIFGNLQVDYKSGAIKGAAKEGAVAKEISAVERKLSCWVLVAQACNPSYLGDIEDFNSRSAQKNSSGNPISKITRAKWTGSVAQAVKHLLCKHEFKPQSQCKICTETRQDVLKVSQGS
jgi:hypothetical protein